MFCIDFQIIKRCIRKNKKSILQFSVLRWAVLGWGSLVDPVLLVHKLALSAVVLPMISFKKRKKPNLNKKVHTQYIHDLSHAHNSLASLFQAFNEFLGEAQV